MTPRDAARFFGGRVSKYDAAYERVDSGGHVVRARMATAERLLGRGPGSVLDAGMGPGRMCAELARLGWTVSGVDAAEEMVEVARTRLPDARERLLVGTIEDLPFPDASFDAVVATGVLEYSQVPRAVAELARVLRPGGLAVVSYPNNLAFFSVWNTRVFYTVVRAIKRALGRPHPWMPRGSGVIPPAHVERMFLSCGLIPTDREYCGYLVVLPPVDLILPRLSASIAGRLERRAPRWLATQVVYAGRKRNTTGPGESHGSARVPLRARSSASTTMVENARA